MGHQVTAEVVEDLTRWLHEVLPPGTAVAASDG